MSALATIGIGRTMEKKLGAVGITTVEELAEVGSREAVRRLKARDPSICLAVLYRLELDSGCRARLKEYFNGL